MIGSGVAGHSLGGAMATLAAYDLSSLCKPGALTVYVYGCPRTGNHAFAKDYKIKVPNTWQVMTDRVCRSCNPKYVPHVTVIRNYLKCKISIHKLQACLAFHSVN